MSHSFAEVVKGKLRGYDEEEYDFNDDEIFGKDKGSTMEPEAYMCK